MSALWYIPTCICRSHWIFWGFITCFELHHVFKIYSYSKSQFALKYVIYENDKRKLLYSETYYKYSTFIMLTILAYIWYDDIKKTD